MSVIKDLQIEFEEKFSKYWLKLDFTKTGFTAEELPTLQIAVKSAAQEFFLQKEAELNRLEETQLYKIGEMTGIMDDLEKRNGELSVITFRQQQKVGNMIIEKFKLQDRVKELEEELEELKESINRIEGMNFDEWFLEEFGDTGDNIFEPDDLHKLWMFKERQHAREKIELRKEISKLEESMPCSDCGDSGVIRSHANGVDECLCQDHS